MVFFLVFLLHSYQWGLWCLFAKGSPKCRISLVVNASCLHVTEKLHSVHYYTEYETLQALKRNTRTWVELFWELCLWLLLLFHRSFPCSRWIKSYLCEIWEKWQKELLKCDSIVFEITVLMATVCLGKLLSKRIAHQTGRLLIAFGYCSDISVTYSALM